MIKNEECKGMTRVLQVDCRSITKVSRSSNESFYSPFLHFMDNKTVLIVEDDENIAELLTIHLRDLGCKVLSESDGQKALSKARQESFDLVILDIVLPGLNGMEICRMIRQQDQKTPIIMLTARSEEIDKVLGLECGADDYLTKPFSIREFIARVKAIFRRTEEKPLSVQANVTGLLHFGTLSIDTDKRKVALGNERIELSPKEFELLVLLASHPGKSYSRKQLLNMIWGYDFEGYEHTVNSHINRLRNKVEKDLSKPEYILTTWGVGYRFNEKL